MKISHILISSMLVAPLAACGGTQGESGTTSTEERQLDEAAAALDEAQAEYETAIRTPEPEPADPGDEEH
ncbi:hypothetical protein HFP57_08730 [Parasphingopyxis algicola]|uniref:hypothetical protein n=1 Tax=Parasphingopyxis algicola TaxID=2026624 RepID=UPI0015A4B68D|nr:hypothetical protein [Parasphingopyxis algicola]QLC25100.1 hypothetical protein HFP57_08730 [Parasphingopyxis algicola]